MRKAVDMAAGLCLVLTAEAEECARASVRSENFYKSIAFLRKIRYYIRITNLPIYAMEK